MVIAKEDTKLKLSQRTPWRRTAATVEVQFHLS